MDGGYDRAVFGEFTPQHVVIDRHALHRTSPLRENNLPPLLVHSLPRHPISTFQVVAPGHFRDWSLITGAGGWGVGAENRRRGGGGK